MNIIKFLYNNINKKYKKSEKKIIKNGKQVKKYNII